MSTFQTATIFVATVVLFLHGLQGFSQEVQAAGSSTFQSLLGKLTKTRFRGFLLGLGITSLVQSSSAVSSITVALVDSGAITFRNSLAVLLGAKIGTTGTAWLVSFELASIGAFFIVAGAVLGVMPVRAKIFGKALFYFGFILFALDLLSGSLEPIRESPFLRELLGATASLPLSVLIGVIVTLIVQSSSVTSGLAVVLAQQGVVAPEAAIAVVIGASIGTTSTALIASAKMGSAAKRAARANTLFNVVGAVALLPFLDRFSAAILAVGLDDGKSVALAQLVFAVVVTIPFLIFLRPFERLVFKLWPPSTV
ncbi:MAG: Na/Pi cotransporter family protein [Myxococcales bacterium]|nr:Na/Pi cotransporter family protein [Myxococcales bacterium]